MEACKPTLGLRLEIAALGATLPSSGLLCSLTYIRRLVSAPFPVPRSTVKCCRLLVLLNSFIFRTVGERMGSNSGMAATAEEEKYIYFRSRVGLEAGTELALLGKMTCLFQSGVIII